MEEGRVRDHRWENVSGHTWRCCVPGGWLYKENSAGAVMCFVPYPEPVVTIATPLPGNAEAAREGRARALAVEALHRIEVGDYCGVYSCAGSAKSIAVDALSGRALGLCPGHDSGSP
jgi:hypothetical protein